MTVIATDNGQPETKNSTAMVTITIFPPDNHFNPVLDKQSYTGYLDENSPPGTSILTITATDADLVGPASTIEQFILEGINSQYFYVENLGNNTAILRSKWVYRVEFSNLVYYYM